VDSFLLTPGPGGGTGGFFNTSFWAELPHRFTGNISWASFFLAALYAVRIGLTDDPVERSYRAWAAKASLLVGFLVLVPQVLGGVFFVELIKHGQPAAFAHSFMGPQAWMWMVQVSLLSLLLVGSSLYFALSRRGAVGVALAGLVLAAGVVSALPPAAFGRLFWVRYVALAAAILLSLAAWLTWLRRERQLELVAPARAALAVTGVAAVALLLLMGVIRSSARDPYTVYGRLDQQHSQGIYMPGRGHYP
jgi:cytochrome bd-type quinol oxidase subunit 1